MSTGSLSQR